ncbi:unnamed protein product [Tenebrio molitor]|nr:unnamed protein product [Tenebrio molitor]
MGSRSSTHATLEVQKEEEKNLRKRNKRLKNESKREKLESRHNRRKTAKRKKDYKKEVHELAVNKEFSTEEVETKLTKVGGELITARDKILETLKHNKNQLHSYMQSLEALKNELQIVIIKDHTESDKKKILFEEEFLNTFRKLQKRNELLLAVQNNTRSIKHLEESDKIENSLKTFKENTTMRKSAMFNLILNTAMQNHLRQAELKFQHFTDELKNLKDNVGQISEVTADIYVQKTSLIEKMDNTILLLSKFSTAEDLQKEALPVVEINVEKASKAELSHIENKLEIVKSQLSQFIEKHCEIDEILLRSVQKFEGFRSIELLEEEKAALLQQISKLKSVVKEMMKLIEIVEYIEEDIL